jgi:hypothetical protein
VAPELIQDLGLPYDAVLVAIFRGDETIIPRGSATIEPGDDVICLTTPEVEDELRDAGGRATTDARLARPREEPVWRQALEGIGLVARPGRRRGRSSASSSPSSCRCSSDAAASHDHRRPRHRADDRAGPDRLGLGTSLLAFLALLIGDVNSATALTIGAAVGLLGRLAGARG